VLCDTRIDTKYFMITIDTNPSTETLPTPVNTGWLTKKQIALRYNMSERQIDYLREKGILPYYVVPSHCIRFDPQECDLAMRKFKRNGESVASGQNGQRNQE
jgi:hypothetical protein